MGRTFFGLILSQLLFAIPLQAQGVFAPAKANGKFVMQKVPTPRAPATKTIASTTNTGMGLAVTSGRPAAATGLVPVGMNSNGMPVYPANPLVGPQNMGSGYNGMPFGAMPPQYANSQMMALAPLMQAFSSFTNGTGSALGGPRGSGKNAYSNDYSDYMDVSGNYHSSKSTTVSRSSKPAGPGSGSGGGYRCDGNRLTGTFYNLPYEATSNNQKTDPLRNSYASYPMFINKRYLGNSYITGTKIPNGGAVNMEGSGVCSDSDNSACGPGQGGNIIHFNGHIDQNPCPKYFGEASPPAGPVLSADEAKNSLDPSFARPNGANCIVPFYSVAADPHVPRGAIVEVEEFKNKTIYLPPNGIKKPHPELFMVGDRGSAITDRDHSSPNRFDFFTGSYEQKDKMNVFGNSSPDGDTQMDIKSCRNHVKVILPTDPDYPEKLKEIQQSLAQVNGKSATAGPQQQLAQQQSETTN
jgi:hypothetical protein